MLNSRFAGIPISSSTIDGPGVPQLAEPRGANVESRDRLRWPASFRNGGRNQIGTVADIKSESPAGLPRNSHRVEAQAVEDILQTQFTEIEAAVLDYQNETLVAFVAAPSICEGEISVVAPAPAEWAARVTAMLAKQLPAPSIPTRIFVVEKFVMKPVSGKIDRTCLS